MRYQRVRIISPAPVDGRLQPAIGTHIEVDGVEWQSVIAYRVEGSVNGVQEVTLTFRADVTIERAAKA